MNARTSSHAQLITTHEHRIVASFFVANLNLLIHIWNQLHFSAQITITLFFLIIRLFYSYFQNLMPLNASCASVSQVVTRATHKPRKLDASKLSRYFALWSAVNLIQLCIQFTASKRNNNNNQRNWLSHCNRQHKNQKQSKLNQNATESLFYGEIQLLLKH